MAPVWVPFVMGPLLVLSAVAPLLIMYRSGRRSQHPEKINPPSWAATEVGLFEDGFSVARKGKDGATRFSRVGWKRTIWQHSDEAWLIGSHRTAPVLIPRSWIPLAQDQEAIDQFFHSLSKWQIEPGNLAQTSERTLPEGWEELGHSFAITGAMEYKLSRKIASEFRRKLPKYESLGPQLRWCFFIWLVVIVVSATGCVSAWLRSVPALQTWIMSFAAGGVLAMISYFLFAKLVRRPLALGVVTTDSIRVSYDGEQQEIWLRDLPQRLLVRDAAVAATKDGVHAVVLPKQAFNSEASWQSVCEELGVA